MFIRLGRLCLQGCKLSDSSYKRRPLRGREAGACHAKQEVIEGNAES